ncbi:MAG: MATE family efflux transporter [Spirochaetes bacterium]|nr:MATE family efflux transporter [Spirochaetota bacterium]
MVIDSTQYRIRYILRHSWSISWPMIIIMLMDFFVGITDVYIAGKLGKEVQASIGFISQIYFVFMVIVNGITVGAVSLISRLFGAGKSDELSQAVTTLLFSSIAAGVLIGVPGVLFSGYGIRLLNLPESLKEYIIPLVKIYLGGVLFHYFLITSNGVLRSCKMVKHSLKAMVVVCTTNIVLNFFLVFFTPFGFYGIVVSTVISYAAGSFVNIFRISNICTGKKTFNISLLKRMFKIGWPTGLQQMAWHIGGTVLFLIVSMIPENTIAVIAALTNGLKIEAAIYVIAYAFNSANAVIIGNFLGEKRYKDAFKSGIVTGVLGVIIISIQTVIVILNADWIASIISPNHIVINETMRYLYINMLSEPFMAWAVITSGALLGSGDTKTVMKIVISSQWLIRLPLAYLFVVHFNYGPTAVWWVMDLSILVHAIFVSIRYFRKKWIYNNI